MTGSPVRAPSAADPLSTRSHVRRAQRGDGDATDRLFSRLLNIARRWAHGRLPRSHRTLLDTADVAQEVAGGAWRNLGRLTITSPGDLEAYVRQAVWNRIRDQGRRLQRSPLTIGLDSGIPAEAESPLDVRVRREQEERYRLALSHLAQSDLDLIVARAELGHSFQDIATLFDKPSAAAARMAVNRAVERLTALMQTSRLSGWDRGNDRDRA